MQLSVSVKREYVPKFMDNDKALAADQFRIVHRAPSASLKDMLFPRVYQFNTEGKLQGSFEVDRKKVLSAFITDIVNLSYKEDGEKSPIKITSVDHLFSAPPDFDALIDELYEYFQGMFSNKEKVDEKN